MNTHRHREKLKDKTISHLIIQSEEYWQEIRCLGKNISPRSYHSAVLYQDDLYVYGGYEVHDGILSDFHRLRNLKWEKLPSIDIPKRKHTAVVYKDQMLILGGQTTSTTSTSEMNLFDFIHLKWYSLQSCQFTIDSHSAIIYNDKMIVFGGYMVDRYSNRVLSFDLLENKWEEFEINDNRPSERASVGMCTYQTSFFIFGGTNGVQKFDDLWQFDLIKKKWRSIKTQNPQARHGLSMVCAYDCLFLFGGIRDITREKNDLYAYDISSNIWIHLQSDLSLTQSKNPNINLLPPISNDFQTIKTFQSSRKKSNINILRTPKKTNSLLRNHQKKMSLSPLMLKILKSSENSLYFPILEFEEQQQYQIFYAMNLTLEHQQKRRVRIGN